MSAEALPSRVHCVLPSPAHGHRGHLDRSGDHEGGDQRGDVHFLRDLSSGGCSNLGLTRRRPHRGSESRRPSPHAHGAISRGDGPLASGVYRSSISDYDDRTARPSRSDRGSSRPWRNSSPDQGGKTAAERLRRSPLGPPLDSEGRRLSGEAPDCCSRNRKRLGGPDSRQLPRKAPPIDLVEQLVQVPLTPEIGRLVGSYLAEGSADDRRLVFSFHVREQAYRDDIRAIAHKYFGLRGKEESNTGKGRNARFDSYLLARVFGSLGHRCDEKRIPGEIMTSRREVRAQVVRGLWRGDGYRDPARSYFGISTTSSHLAYQTQELLASLGIVAGVTSTRPKGKRRAYHLLVTGEFVAPMARLLGLPFSETRNRTASPYIMDDEFSYASIRKIRTKVVQDLPVFNLEVEEDETYVAAGHAVHNCVRKCPFDAIRIIGLPEALKEDLVHQYGKNAFRLFRIPVPKKGEVIGLLGPNGIGKTTCVSMLSGEIAPNLGHYRRKKPHWDDVLDYFAGTEVHGYLEKIANKELTTAIKPQYVYKLRKIYSGKVRDLLRKTDRQGKLDELTSSLELGSFLDRDIAQLSGGELQRLAIAATMLKDADVYFFDEPSSYLDIYQRLQVAKVIQSLSKEKYVVVVEHDLAVLDFLADTVFLMYGEEGAYGIIAQPRPVRTAINVYLGGYLKEENIRFREREIRFDVRPPRADWKAETLVAFDELTKRYEGFELVVHPGHLRKGEVVGVVGPNATGKTTFVKMLAGEEAPTSGAVQGKWQVSYKPQYLEAVYEGTVGDLLRSAVGKKADSGHFETEILQPLQVKGMMARDVSTLSGGELQRVAIALCLGRDADIYLLDEPSAYLDSNQRMEAARTIRRVMEKESRTGLIVDP